MNPEMQIAVAVVTLVEKLGGWSMGGFLAFVLITPAVFVYLSARIVVKAINGLREKLTNFEFKYDNNIKFVEDYGEQVEHYEKLTLRLEDTLRRNTIILTKLVDRFDTIKKVNHE